MSKKVKAPADIKLLKAQIKALYKRYDKCLDHIVVLEELLNNKSDSAQGCFRELKKYSHNLNELLKRGKALSVS